MCCLLLCVAETSIDIGHVNAIELRHVVLARVWVVVSMGMVTLRMCRLQLSMLSSNSMDSEIIAIWAQYIV